MVTQASSGPCGDSSESARDLEFSPTERLTVAQGFFDSLVALERGRTDWIRRDPRGRAKDLAVLPILRQTLRLTEE